jgi:iron(II)-dependent oxidoreductase
VFMMGSKSGASDERPVHQVRVKTFMMSKTEVTVAQYRSCVNSGICSAPNSKSNSKSCNWGYADREDHPINCVSWFQLNEFAQWVGGRLPTEAEWEYAARSRGRDIAHPWGDQKPSCQYVVMSDGGSGCGKDHTWPVCSKPLGNTEQGLCDMAGSVSEWLLDEYARSYDGAPTDGSARCDAHKCSKHSSANRVLRGMGWVNTHEWFSVTLRNASPRSTRYYNIGGRVVRPISPKE